MDLTPRETIHEYLTAAGERRMSDAASYLADGAALVFPQGRFDDLNAMAAAMSGRYRTISKTYDTWDSIEDGGTTVVFTTHSSSQAQRMSDHPITIVDGEVRACDEATRR